MTDASELAPTPDAEPLADSGEGIVPGPDGGADEPTESTAATAQPRVELDELRAADMAKLVRLARERGVESAANERRQALTFQILASQADRIETEGVVEVLSSGYGFLRGTATSYLAGPDDIYVSPSQVRRFGLQTGDTLAGSVRVPRDGERYFALDRIHTLNHGDPAAERGPDFYALTPLHPHERFQLEVPGGDVATRIMDMLCPIGKGQRALLVSPPRAGKTVLMQHIATAITTNHPEIVLIVLLVDERPEEVTEMARNVRGEVVSSTFDEPATRHVQVADAVIRKARRLAENGKDVVILLDSITRLARAHNTVTPISGRIMSGGVDAKALHKPKRFFGSARKLEEGGSLTIIATALIETGSRMDEVIFEEFKGTGNSEIVMSRKLADRRIWPAFDLNRSGTRKEELLLGEETIRHVWLLRKVIQPLDPADAIQLLVDRLGKTATNEEFLASMKLA